MNISVLGSRLWRLRMHWLFLSSSGPPAPRFTPSPNPRPRLELIPKPRPSPRQIQTPTRRSRTTPRKSRSKNAFCFSYHLLVLQEKEATSPSGPTDFQRSQVQQKEITPWSSKSVFPTLEVASDVDQAQPPWNKVFLIICFLSKRKTLSSPQSKTPQSAILRTKD